MHEIGHAIDDGLGRDHSWNSTTDQLINDIFDREALNRYSRQNVREAWSEWFRAWCDMPNPLGFSNDLDVGRSDESRADLQRYAPTAAGYLDALHRSAELALDQNPVGFTTESDLDVGLEIVLRSRVALELHVAPEEVSIEELIADRQLLPQYCAAEVDQDVADSLRDIGNVEFQRDRHTVSRSASRPLRGPTMLRSAIREVHAGLSGRVKDDVLIVGAHHIAIATSSRSYVIVERSTLDLDVAVLDPVDVRIQHGRGAVTAVQSMERVLTQGRDR